MEHILERPAEPHVESNSTYNAKTTSWMKPVEGVAALLVLSIIGLLLIGIFTRYVLRSPVHWVDESAGLAFLWLAMLGSAIAVDRAEHMRLTIFLPLFPARLTGFLQCLAMVLVIATIGALIYPAYDYALGESDITSVMLNISQGYRASAFPVGLLLMGALVVTGLVRDHSLPMIALATATVFATGAACWFFADDLAAVGLVDILSLFCRPGDLLAGHRRTDCLPFRPGDNSVHRVFHPSPSKYRYRANG
jgi:TRAP-type C4-dicarboxylate transport system permease small subunit